MIIFANILLDKGSSHLNALMSLLLMAVAGYMLTVPVMRRLAQCASCWGRRAEIHRLADPGPGDGGRAKCPKRRTSAWVSLSRRRVIEEPAPAQPIR